MELLLQKKIDDPPELLKFSFHIKYTTGCAGCLNRGGKNKISPQLKHEDFPASTLIEIFTFYISINNH